MASWTLYVTQPATITIGLQEPHRQQLFLEHVGCEPQASKSLQVVLGPLLLGQRWASFSLPGPFSALKLWAQNPEIRFQASGVRDIGII